MCDHILSVCHVSSHWQADGSGGGSSGNISNDGACTAEVSARHSSAAAAHDGVRSAISCTVRQTRAFGKSVSGAIPHSGGQTIAIALFLHLESLSCSQHIVVITILEKL